MRRGIPESGRVIPGDFALSVGDAKMPAPEGWRWHKLTDLARLETGHTPSRDHPEYWHGEVPWIGITDARNNHGAPIKATAQTVTPEGLANSAARLLPEGTVCLSRTASVGYVTVMGRPMATSQDFVNWVCGPELDPDFLMHLFLAEAGSLRRFGQGTTHTTIYFPEVQAFRVCIPSIIEQRRVVSRLQRLRAHGQQGRTAIEAVPGLVDRLRQSILAAAFRGDLTADWRAAHADVEPASELLKRIRAERRRSWEEAKATRLLTKGKAPSDDRWKARYEEPEVPDDADLPELPDSWCWATLRELAEIKGGVTKGQKRAEGTKTRPVPYLRVANVQRGYLDLQEVSSIDTTEREISELRLQPGDILFNEGGDRDKLGRGWVWDGEIAECIHQNHVFRARLASDDVDPRLVSWYANSGGQDYFLREGSQTTNLASINITSLGRLPIPLVPSEEQAVMTGQVSAALALVTHLESALTALDGALADLEVAVLAKAFRGDFARP